MSNVSISKEKGSSIHLILTKSMLSSLIIFLLMFLSSSDPLRLPTCENDLTMDPMIPDSTPAQYDLRSARDMCIRTQCGGHLDT